MSRPPWGKVAGVSLTEGGNSLTSEDCPPTNAPTPTTPTQTKSHQTRKAIQSRKQAPPLQHPNGCHLSPKGEAYFIKHACIYIEGN